MTLNRRQILRAAASAVAVLPAVPFGARAQVKGEPQAGTDYMVLKTPQAVESGSGIEVLDFFQYSCPHCFHFLPELSAWKKHLPADVDYRYLPVVFDERTAPHAKILYALEALKKIDEMHAKVFNAIQVDHRPLLDTAEIADFMASAGIDRAQWLATFNSFSVATRVLRAGQVWRAYQIDGTPSLGCDGKYLTSPSMVRSASGALQVMDYLIDRVRHERMKKG
jgi:thiol:disulfide interchange protein DsbA